MEEVFVTVVKQGDSAVLVADGDTEAWIPYSTISEDSDINEYSEEADSGDLLAKAWLLEDRGLI